MAKDKITIKGVREFLSNAAEKDRLWDTQLPAFHLVKRKAGGRWAIKYRDSAGKPRTFGLGTYPALTVDQARRMAHEALADVQQGKDPLAKREASKAEALHRREQTVGLYLEGPYTLQQSRKKGGKATLGMLRLHFDAWVDKPMSDLSRSDVERWQVSMEKKTLAFSTLERVYGAMQTMLNSAKRRGTIPANPIKDVRLERPAMSEDELADSATSRRYLEPWEEDALFAALDAYQEERREQRRNSRAHGKPYLPSLDDVSYVDYVMPWTLAMYYMGFRPGDLYGLRWEHVNLNFATVTKTIEKTAHHQPDPRTFPISKPLLSVLKAWWRQSGKPVKGYVWPNDKSGERRTSSSMRKPWEKIKALSLRLAEEREIEKGLDPDLDLYTLRHNFASQLIMSGADLLTVSKLMAHTDINTTIKHYGHLRPDHARDYIEQFAMRRELAGELTRAAG